jgi:membrane-associated phospholipid phosphatase
VQRRSEPRFPWLLWLIAGATVIGLGFWLEGRVDAALATPEKSALGQFAWWCSKLGEGQIVGGVGIFFAAVYFFLNRPRVAAQIFSVFGSALLIGLTGTIFRVLIGRTRPPLHGPKDVLPGFYGVWHDGHWIIGKAAFSAFPSGHSAVAAGLAVAACLVSRSWGTVAWIYALAVMWSRVALQWHHLADVLASAVLAFPLAWLLKKHIAPTVDFQFDNFYRAWKKK